MDVHMYRGVKRFSKSYARSVTIGSVALLAAIAASPVTAAEPPVHECDRLATSPDDPKRVAEGLVIMDMSVDRAMEACREALKAFPDTPRFQYQLGRTLYRAQLYQEANAVFRRAAEQGYAAAMYAVATLYHVGAGVEKDADESIAWFRRAARLGHRRAQVILGSRSLRGVGGPPDYQEAMKWLQMAAKQDDPYAQTNIAAMYEHGLGVERDYKKAIDWYLKAAKQGLAKAQFDLARLYETGKGVPQDHRQAARWYRKAAIQALQALDQYD